MKKIGISDFELKIISEILKNYKNSTVIFGSRVKGSFKKFSDLDICLKTKIFDADFEFLQEKFDNSDLPFKVDIVVYDQLSDAFKKIIDIQGLPLAEILKN
jgi:predicted nucleotidyltransferase